MNNVLGAEEDERVEDLYCKALHQRERQPLFRVKGSGVRT